MFGLSKLTEEEKAAHDKKRRIQFLEKQVEKERAVREKSLVKSLEYNEELTKLGGV